MTKTIFVLSIALLFFPPQPLAAQQNSLQGLTWTEQKCVLYQHAFADALDLLGREGISKSFLAANTAFIETGCIDERRVCPQSDDEFELANILTIMTMNEGMASTFVPFSCPD